MLQQGQKQAWFFFSQSESGWQTLETFESYLKVLIVEMKHVPKLILIMYDNHPSHINMELFKYCSERDVHIITFPPNTTSLLKMADVSVFGPSKTAWRNELLLWERMLWNLSIRRWKSQL